MYKISLLQLLPFCFILKYPNEPSIWAIKSTEDYPFISKWSIYDPKCKLKTQKNVLYYLDLLLPLIFCFSSCFLNHSFWAMFVAKLQAQKSRAIFELPTWSIGLKLLYVFWNIIMVDILKVFSRAKYQLLWNSSIDDFRQFSWGSHQHTWWPTLNFIIL